jgi:hypothetical protein
MSWRNPTYRQWLRDRGCSIPGCGGGDMHAHHWRTPSNGGMGMKPGDHYCLPLCADHHQQLHDKGKLTWAEAVGWGAMDEWDVDSVALRICMALLEYWLKRRDDG